MFTSEPRWQTSRSPILTLVLALCAPLVGVQACNSSIVVSSPSFVLALLSSRALAKPPALKLVLVLSVPLVG